MAFSIALRRLAGGSSLLNSLCRPPIRSLSVVPSATTSSNDSSQVSGVDAAGSLEVQGRADRSVPRQRQFLASLPDVLGPSSPAQNLSQLMKVKEQLLGSPFTTLSRGMLVGGRTGLDVKAGNTAAFHLSMRPFATLSSTAGAKEADAAPHLGIENKKNLLRPLSPHLPVYQPHLSSILSIFNRISAVILTGVVLAFYLLYLKLGLICFTFHPFYELLFYSTKLNLITVEITALALVYHIFGGVRHLLEDFEVLSFLKRASRLK